MRRLFYMVLGRALWRLCEEARERCYANRVRMHSEQETRRERLESLSLAALKSEGAEAAYEAAWEAAQAQAEEEAEADRRLEAEVDGRRADCARVAKKCRPLRAVRRQTRTAALKAAREGLAEAVEELNGSCGGSLIYERRMERLKADSIRRLRALLDEEAFARLLDELDIELDDEDDDEDDEE